MHEGSVGRLDVDVAQAGIGSIHGISQGGYGVFGGIFLVLDRGKGHERFVQLEREVLDFAEHVVEEHRGGRIGGLGSRGEVVARGGPHLLVAGEDDGLVVAVEVERGIVF